MSEQTQHPPIPPNCNHFATQHGVEVFLNPRAESFESWPVKYSQQNEREIIAAVAEVAWRKEAERIIEDVVQDAFYPEDFEHAGTEEKAALQNAEAWRKWGGA